MGISNDDMPRMGSVIDGKHGLYVLGEEVGQGGNGTVFDVSDVNRKDNVLYEGQELVVKILTLTNKQNFEEKTKRRERFLREVKAVRQINDPDIDVLPIIDSYIDVDNYSCEWYVMPKAREYKYGKKGFELEKLKQFRRIGVTLSKLHIIGIYHRDIKPKNIMFYKNRCFLTDFGLVWNIEEDNHITGENEALGPVGIRPPEMESHVDKLNVKIDYQKVDVYLFVKTLWIVLTGNRNGFRGEYNRSERMVYLDKDQLSLGKSIEPLHKMMEEATRHNYFERITIDQCLEYIDQQIAIAEKNISDKDLFACIFDESMAEIKHQITSDATLFSTPEKIRVALSKIVNTVEVVGEELGETIYLGILYRIELVGSDLFKLSLKGNFSMGARKKRVVYLRITQMSVNNDNLSRIITGKFSNQIDVNIVVSSWGDYIRRQEPEIGISGEFTFILREIGSQ